LFLINNSLIFAKTSKITLKNDVFMAFSDRLSYARKQKKIRQADLGRMVGTSGDIIGKYERGENVPSIDVATKIADALGVTIDYLVKDGEYQHIDNDTLKRLREIQNLSQEDRTHLFYMIDNLIKVSKLKAI
jgi:transcriptional regulator with XRE-family HTH domain